MSRQRAVGWTFSVACTGLLLASNAWADEGKVCADAYVRAQSLRDAHHPIEAREALKICTRPTCAKFIVQDCSTWLATVDTAIPTVVLSATDGAGHEVTQASVTLDTMERPLTTELDGRAIEIEPGDHEFLFATKDGRQAVVRTVIREGVKLQQVTARLVSPQDNNRAAFGQAPPSLESLSISSRRGSGQRTAGLLLAALGGGAGVAIGSIFGAIAINDKNNQIAACASASNCPDPQGATNAHSDAVTTGAVSTIGFVAAGVFLATGLVVYFTAPHAGPMVSVGIGPGSISFGGRF